MQIPTSQPVLPASARTGTYWSEVIQDYSIVAIESRELQLRVGNFGNEYEKLKLKVCERRTLCEITFKTCCHAYNFLSKNKLSCLFYRSTAGGDTKQEA